MKLLHLWLYIGLKQWFTYVFDLGQTKITKCLSIPRHNMLDIQPDQIPSEQQQHQYWQLNAKPLSHIQSLADQKSISPPNQQGVNTLQSVKWGDLQSSSVWCTIRSQMSAIAEEDPMKFIDDRLENDDSSFYYTNRTVSQRLDESDYSQMNHVDYVSSSRNSRNLVRHGSEQLKSNVMTRQLSPLTPITGSQLHLTLSHTSQEFNEQDHLAEIESIFSYLADEENDVMEHDFAFSAAASPRETDPAIQSRPSLRHRRDVRCQNLVILNQRAKSSEKPTPLKRRLTLPSIMKYGAVGPVVGRGTGTFVASNNEATDVEQKPMETIVIENGVRKRLEEEKEYRPAPLPPDIDLVEELIGPPKELPKRYKLESVKLTKKPDLGSLPDVSMFHQLEGIPRQEAEILCRQKREELHMMRELQDQLYRRAVVLKIGDFKVTQVPVV